MVVISLPDNGEFDVPLELAAAVADLAAYMSMAMAPRAPAGHNNSVLHSAFTSI